MLAWVRTRALPWAVWAGSLVTAVVLWTDVRRESAVGFALGTEYMVAPHIAGRIETLQVSPGQRVRAGQIVATLDAEAIDAELAILAAERERLSAELGAVRSDSQVRNFDTLREFDESVAASELALRTARSDRNIRAAEYKAMTSQTEVLKSLVDKRMADRRDLDALLVQHTALHEELQTADAHIRGLASAAAAAKTRRQLLPTDAATQAVRPLQAELAVIAGQEQLLAARRAEIVLRAPADGEVAAIHLRPGEVAVAGAPIVTIVAATTSEVMVCLREHQAGHVVVGQRVELSPRDRGGPGVPGHITRVGPRIAELPQRCWRNPEITEWGREAVVLLSEPAPLLAGQAFAVAFTNTVDPPPAAPVDEPPAAVAPAAKPTGDQPRPITIPPALAARTRFEPSALAWSSARARFLVVSDDTGLADHDEHAPWLFTMDERGVLDPNPLVVAGLESFSDLESIAPGPGDSFYLLASQSHSRKGKRPGARQVFARIVVDATGARAEAQVRLAERLDEGGAALLSTLGLTDTQHLDIEGLTATARGGLLLGLKEPLDERGEAVIWHLPKPDALLSGSGAVEAGLQRLGTVPLRVRADGLDVPGGISDLLELPDGSLLLATTKSGEDPGSQDGAVWHATSLDELAAAKKLVSFPGLKPEGLALRADDAAIVVVFDTGDAPPPWTEFPWSAR